MSKTENNKLIAKFMGYESYQFRNHTVFIYEEDNHRTDIDLHYHKDWNWLMPVVEKIEKYLWDNQGKVGYFDDGLQSNDIEVRYQAVVEFINQYNK